MHFIDIYKLYRGPFCNVCSIHTNFLERFLKFSKSVFHSSNKLVTLKHLYNSAYHYTHVEIIIKSFYIIDITQQKMCVEIIDICDSIWAFVISTTSPIFRWSTNCGRSLWTEEHLHRWWHYAGKPSLAEILVKYGLSAWL